MPGLMLVLAGLCEVGWAIGLKYTNGFTLAPILFDDTIALPAKLDARCRSPGQSLRRLPGARPKGKRTNDGQPVHGFRKSLRSHETARCDKAPKGAARGTVPDPVARFGSRGVRLQA
jgi:hypothetical protein